MRHPPGRNQRQSYGGNCDCRRREVIAGAIRSGNQTEQPLCALTWLRVLYQFRWESGLWLFPRCSKFNRGHPCPSPMFRRGCHVPFGLVVTRWSRGAVLPSVQRTRFVGSSCPLGRRTYRAPAEGPTYPQDRRDVGTSPQKDFPPKRIHLLAARQLAGRGQLC